MNCARNFRKSVNGWLYWEILFDLPNKEKELTLIEQEMAQPGFWGNQTAAQEKVNQLKILKTIVLPYHKLKKESSDNLELSALATESGGEKILDELVAGINPLEKSLEHLEYQLYLNGPNDQKNIFLNIHAGTGGTDACDWAAILLRMYLRWLDKNNYENELIDSLDGDTAGIRHATIYAKGPYAFGFLKSEIGVHRLVRISPFDSNKRRHTSFAAIDITPEAEIEEIDINENDLKIDTYSAGGPGGQHVNKTASAIRITHLPTGIIVQCQNQRSQHSNKQTAFKLLASKLNALKQKEKEDEFKKIYGEKGEIAWGYQIRSYVLQPYTLVKDHRTEVENGNINAVLDGDLDMFIEAYLQTKKK
jgi:peptide chain release factor 2